MNQKLIDREVEYHLLIHPEDAPIEGNASAIDDETDKQTEAWIHDQLNRGNQWAWCAVEVQAVFRGHIGRDWLGCCSYSGEKSFTQGGYYDDMKAEALRNLIEKLESASNALKVLRS